MDVATGRVLLGAATVRFEDHLGRRYQADGPAGEPLEVLVLRDALCASPGFEEALRQQVRRLASFPHPSFGHIRGVARVARSEAGLAVISDRVKGVRLSDLIGAAGKRQRAVDPSAALWITRQLLAALAAFHQAGPDVHHGALAPHRIVITPDGRPMVMEQVLGPALAKARLAGAFGEDGPGATHGQSTDVREVATVALALLLGRVQGDTAVQGTATALEQVTKVARDWMSRALQVEPHTPFTSAVDALEAFERAIGELDARGAEGARRFVEAATKPIEPVRLKVDTTTEEPGPSTPSREAATKPVEPVRLKADTTTEDIRRVREDPAYTEERTSVGPSTRKRLVAAAAVVVAMVSGAMYATHRYYSASAEAAPTGTLVINTDPPDAAVVIDGADRGRSPVRLTLAPGPHVLDINSGEARRRFAVSITAGTEVQQFIELPKAPVDAVVAPPPVAADPAEARAPTPEGPVSGWVTVATPAEVEIFENRRLVGSSRLDRIMLSVGRHELELVNESLGYRATRTVNVAPGQVARVAPEWPKGSLALNAVPWADVWVDEERVGETPIGNVQVPVGSHEVIFRHPDLGEQRHTVIVTTTGQVRVIADMRRR